MRHYLFPLIIFISCNNGPGSKQKKIVDTPQAIHSSDTVSVYRFSDFKVDTFKGKKATVDVRHNPLAVKYGLEYPPNEISKLSFAGHFATFRFQHPANSIGGVIIDLVNGEIFELPKCTLGYSFTKTSRLLIVNPNGHENECYSCKKEYWIWDDSVKVFRNLNK